MDRSIFPNHKSAPALTLSRRTRVLLSFTVGFFLCPASALDAASTESSRSFIRPRTDAIAIEVAPKIDGKLDDACWAVAVPLTNFFQVVPVEGSLPTEKTEVRFAYSKDYLYIAVRCFDSQPARIIATDMRRDSDFDSDDLIFLAFDTFNRQHDGYFFSVNPLGARADGLIENFNDQKFEWDAVWEAKTDVDETGWTAEFAIPFRSISFDAKGGTWGFNLERVIRRKQEVVRWTGLSPAKGPATLSDFGELHGFAGMQQGIGLELRPFVSLKYRNDPAGGGDDWKLRPGGDLTYRITPSLTFNATINTDFAEAEVDERIINLTRFPTFFPEKRDFFLQDSSLFHFGGLHESPTPYYSRRIGLSPSGRPVDIIAGGRVTGRIGDTRIAVLDVQQESYDDIRSKNLFVGRISTRVFEESNVGILATHGDPRINGDNTLIGADFNYLNSRLANGKQIVGHAWVMGTDSDRFGETDGAFGGELSYPNEPFLISGSARQFGESFDPALGFVSRRGIRNYRVFSEYVARPNSEFIRSIRPWTSWRFFTDLENRMIAEEVDVLAVRFENPAGDEFEVQYGYQRDVVDEMFEIGPDVPIPAGDYWDGFFDVDLETSEARPLSANFSFRTGGFYTGNRNEYEVSVDWRPSHHFTLSVDYEFSEVELAAGSFDVHVVATRFNIGFTPDLTWQTLVQYDNLSDDFGLNSRVRWTWRPGNDVFFVVNQGWQFDDWRFRRLQTELTLKVGATFRF